MLLRQTSLSLQALPQILNATAICLTFAVFLVGLVISQACGVYMAFGFSFKLMLASATVVMEIKER